MSNIQEIKQKIEIIRNDTNSYGFDNDNIVLAEILELLSLENNFDDIKTDVDKFRILLETKLEKDLSNLTEDDITSLKEALGVGELPTNIATVDQDSEVGNVYTKDEVDKKQDEKLDKGGYTGTAQDLKSSIDALSEILNSDDVSLNEIQEIVDYVKQNRESISALGINSIIGLAEALNNKAPLSLSELTEEQKNDWKEALGVEALPTNIATIDKEGEVGSVYTKTKTNEFLEEKLDKPTTEATTTEAPFVVGVNSDNESYKLPAGKLGKNIGNTDLQIPAGEVRVLDTTGAILQIKGKSNANNDASYTRRLVENSQGEQRYIDANVMVKQDLIKAATLLNDGEKKKWFAEMNALTSFTGTSIRVCIPPILERKDKHQNIIVRGLGLNLVPDNSYVGLIHQSNGERVEASNKTIVGDAQTLLVELPNSSNFPLGKSKIEVINSGVEAVGDVYVDFVDELEAKQIVGEKIILRGGSSNKQILSKNNFVSLQADDSITGEGDIIAQYQTADIFRGDEDWWYQGMIETPEAGYYESATTGMLSLSNVSSDGIINKSALVSINIFKKGRGQLGQGILVSSGASSQWGFTTNFEVNLIKRDNVLLVIVISQNGKLVMNTITVNQHNNYSITLSLNNTSLTLTKLGFYKI